MKTSPPLRRSALLAGVSLAGVSWAAALIGASAAHAEDKAAILLPGSANDQSWNALGYSILKSLEPHGFKTAYSENVSDADEAEALRDYANHSGFDGSERGIDQHLSRGGLIQSCDDAKELGLADATGADHHGQRSRQQPGAQQAVEARAAGGAHAKAHAQVPVVKYAVISCAVQWSFNAAFMQKGTGLRFFKAGPSSLAHSEPKSPAPSADSTDPVPSTSPRLD